MKRRPLAPTLLASSVGFAVLTISSTALADDPVSAPYNPSVTDLRLVEAPYDSGFVPMNSPLAIQLTAGVYGDLDVSMEGEAVYDWSEGELVFEGGTNTGSAEYAIGAEVNIKILIDVGVQLEFDAPGLPFVFEIPSLDAFDPYLLPGNPTRPAEMDTNVGPIEVASVPIDTEVLGFAVQGELSLDVQVDLVGAVYEGDTIDIATELGGDPTHTADAYLGPVALDLPEPAGQEDTSIYATHNGTAEVEISIHFIPTLSITSPLNLMIAPDLEFDVPILEGGEVILPLTEIELPAPPRPPDPTDEGGETEESGSAEEDSGGDESSAEETESGGDEGGAGAEGGRDDGGCGCSVDNNAGGSLAFALGLLGLVAIRRRK